MKSKKRKYEKSILGYNEVKRKGYAMELVIFGIMIFFIVKLVKSGVKSVEEEERKKKIAEQRRIEALRKKYVDDDEDDEDFDDEDDL